MKINKLLYTSLFLIIFYLFTGWIAIAMSKQTESIKPPEWILGSWGNLAESNSTRTFYFIFEQDNIKYKLGLDKGAQLEDWKIKYKDYKIVQTYSHDSYKIEFIKKDSQISYEFKLQKKDTIYHDSMTYAIIKDSHYMVNHPTSINFILVKR